MTCDRPPPPDAHYADSVPLSARQALASRQLICDGAAVDKAVDQLAVRLTVEWQNEDPVLLSLMPHGIVLAGMLLRRLVFPCRHIAVPVNAEDLPSMDDRAALAQRDVVVITSQLNPGQRQRLTGWAEHLGLQRLVAVVMAAPRHMPAQPPGLAGIEVWPALRTNAQPLLGSGFDVDGYGANLAGLYRVPVGPRS